MKPRTGFFYRDKKRNNQWVAKITFTDPATGQRKQKKFYGETKTEVRIRMDEFKKKLDEEGPQVVIGEKMTFRELAESYRKKKLVPAIFVKGEKVAGLKNHETPSLYLDVLIEHFGDMKLDEITHSDLEAFKLKRIQTPTKFGTQRAIASVNRELDIMRRALNFAVTNRKLARSPFNASKDKSLIQRKQETRRDRFPSFAEELAILGVCAEPREHLAPIVIIAADTGLRKKELMTLEWKKDIDFESRQINVRPENAKDGEARSIPMTGRVYEWMDQLYAMYGDHESGRVFGGLDNPKKAFGTACRLTKIVDLHFHDYRHAFVTRCILAGIPPAVVCKVSGHSSEEWKRYLNVSPDQLRKLLDPFPGQDAKTVRAYGLDVMRQLTEALGYVWRDGQEWAMSAPIRQDEMRDRDSKFVN
jgi:integrase